MTEFQLVGLCAIGQSDDLVSQTDAEHGILSAQRTDGINDRLNVGGVARSIGNEHTIGLQGFYRFCRSVPGNDGHITTPCIQRTDDIHFHSAVDGHDMKSAALALGMTDAAAADAGYRVFGNNGVGKYLQANV